MTRVDAGGTISDSNHGARFAVSWCAPNGVPVTPIPGVPSVFSVSTPTPATRPLLFKCPRCGQTRIVEPLSAGRMAWRAAWPRCCGADTVLFPEAPLPDPSADTAVMPALDASHLRA